MAEVWTAPTVERVVPDRICDERTSLEKWLEFHRATVRQKCAGLTGEQLAQRAVPPSRLSLLGLVRHLTEVERWWFRMHAAQEDIGFRYDPDDLGLDFEELDPTQAPEALSTYDEECMAARAAVTGRSLDDVVPSRGDHPERTRDLRWIFVHVIEEYARHNGHADLLREVIDGSTGD